MGRIISHISFTIFLVNISILSCFSQSNGFTAGAFFNANGMHITGDDQVFWQSNNGYVWGGGGLSGGINVKHDIGKQTFLSLEMRYIRKGSTYEYLGPQGTQEYEVFRLNYIEMPLLFGIRFGEKRKAYRFETGLAIARMFSSVLKTNDFFERNYHPDIENFKNFDLSWIGSIKAAVNRKQNLLLGFRFSYSIMSIHKNYHLYNMVFGPQLEYEF